MTNPAPTPSFDESNFALTLMTSRQSILPKRLTEPGPSEQQIALLFKAAAAAPDHGEIRPWRFVVIPMDKRHVLAEVFAQALQERDAAATPEQIEQAKEKAYRAPFVGLAIANLAPCEPDIDPMERMISLGAALQNVLLMAHSMGFGAGLTSGQAMQSAVLAQRFGLREGERAVCCINVGTAVKRKPARLRPEMDAFVSRL